MLQRKHLAGPRTFQAPVVPLRGIRPMEPHHELCAFNRGEWLFEQMYRGARVLAQFGGGDVAMRTRSGADCTRLFPEVATALASVPGGPFIVVGEVADPSRTDEGSLRRVQARVRHRGTYPGCGAVVYCVFDLVAEFGFDLTRFPLEQRKIHLGRALAADHAAVMVAPALQPGPGSLRAMMDAHRITRAVAKRLDSAYESGRRSKAWVVVERTAAFAARPPNRDTAASVASHGRDQRSPGRRTVIEIEDRFALRDWAMILNTTPDRLLEAVRTVGNRVDNVATHLRAGL
jgi:bifunctional non-homologous end joining protein LigD